MDYKSLPAEVKAVCNALVPGLEEILGSRLYGIYMYGAAMFPGSVVTDIDCHVVLNALLTEKERTDIFRLYDKISKRYPVLGNELDIWYILLKDARQTKPPVHRLKASMRDESWALHCAHIRAGKYLTLTGPEPTDIFPSPGWEDIVSALDHETEYIRDHMNHAAYCVLNLCRIIYSFQNREPVVSKQFSGLWGVEEFPEWKPLIEAALKFYEKTSEDRDKNLLETEIGSFYKFASGRINESR